MAHPVLIVPGYADSGPLHWQSLWQGSDPAFLRLPIEDWLHPRREVWVDTLDRMLASFEAPPVVAAHSLGCLAVAHWAAWAGDAAATVMHGALLVAVPDPVAGPAFPADAVGFAPVPMQRLPFPTIVVAATDDPYGSQEHAQRCADAWGARFEALGHAGHINADSRIGDWPFGRALLEALR